MSSDRPPTYVELIPGVLIRHVEEFTHGFLGEARDERIAIIVANVKVKDERHWVPKRIILRMLFLESGRLARHVAQPHYDVIGWRIC